MTFLSQLKKSILLFTYRLEIAMYLVVKSVIMVIYSSNKVTLKAIHSLTRKKPRRFYHNEKQLFFYTRGNMKSTKKEYHYVSLMYMQADRLNKSKLGKVVLWGLVFLSNLYSSIFFSL